MATLTDIQRKAAETLRPVIHGGKTILITNHGKAVAEVRPYREVREVSEDEFMKLELTDEAIVEAIQRDREEWEDRAQ